MLRAAATWSSAGRPRAPVLRCAHPVQGTGATCATTVYTSLVLGAWHSRAAPELTTEHTPCLVVHRLPRYLPYGPSPLVPSLSRHSSQLWGAAHQRPLRLEVRRQQQHALPMAPPLHQHHTPASVLLLRSAVDAVAFHAPFRGSAGRAGAPTRTQPGGAPPAGAPRQLHSRIGCAVVDTTRRVRSVPTHPRSIADRHLLTLTRTCTYTGAVPSLRLGRVPN